MNILEINNLNKYYGRQHVLYDISFSINSGSIIGLIGPNGAGKSTIMKTIVGLTNGSSGSIKINDEDLTPHHRNPLKRVGTMIETLSLYPNLTGYDHLKLFNNGVNTNQELKQIARETQIESFMNQKSKKYSLGMKQRLGIAMAMLNHPQLLILDEPMNGLDPQSTRDFRDLLLTLSQRGISILISSHLLDELSRIADYYVVINKGSVVKQATAEDFLSSNNELIRISTDNNDKVLSLFQTKGIDSHIEDRYVVFDDQDNSLNTALTIVNKSKIKIIDVRRSHVNLEESLLKLLTNDNQIRERDDK